MVTYIKCVRFNETDTILFTFPPKNEQHYFFDFCPKDLKWVRRKIETSITYIKRPLINTIKCLNFFIRPISDPYRSCFGGNENRKKLLLKFTDL